VIGEVIGADGWDEECPEELADELDEACPEVCDEECDDVWDVECDEEWEDVVMAGRSWYGPLAK
jgi:hypothetical protein